MKNVICSFFITFILLSIVPAYSDANQQTEISCEMVRRISIGKNYQEKYDVWGFYIDELNKRLFYAPSGKGIAHNAKDFNENSISYYGVPYFNNMQGDIHINRNSGNINMQFKDNNGTTVTYIGTCSKVSNTKQF